MKILAGLLLAVLLVAGGAYALWLKPEIDALSSPGARSEDVIFEVPARSSQRAVIEQMQKLGFVRDWRVLYAYARLSKIGAPKSGEYRVAPTASAIEILNKLHKGEVMLHELSFAEGLTYREIAARLDNSGLLSGIDLITLCEDQEFLSEQGIPGKTCEGYLFPDTYFFARGRTPKEIVQTFISRHKELFNKDLKADLPKSGFTHHELVTLASIVEKETGAEEERPHIASVFLNRLKKNMRLETDPTVIYAVILARGAFDGNLHHADLLMDHPYNTYKRTGLPPGPICNPGLKALKAVLHPLKTNDLFFVSQNNGAHVFCPTLECHEAQVKKWQVEYFKKKTQVAAAAVPAGASEAGVAKSKTPKKKKR